MKSYDLDEFRIFVQNEVEKELIRLKDSSFSNYREFAATKERAGMVLDLIYKFKSMKESPELLRRHHETP